MIVLKSGASDKNGGSTPRYSQPAEKKTQSANGRNNAISLEQNHQHVNQV